MRSDLAKPKIWWVNQFILTWADYSSSNPILDLEERSGSIVRSTIGCSERDTKVSIAHFLIQKGCFSETHTEMYWKLPVMKLKRQMRQEKRK